MTEFKKISDVEVLETLTDSDNVLVVGLDGALKQTASSNVKGSTSWNDLTDKPFGEEDGAIKKIDEKYIPYVVITQNFDDNTMSCNVTDINTLVEKLEAFPFVIVRAVASPQGVVMQCIVSQYQVGFNEDNTPSKVIFIVDATNGVALIFNADGTLEIAPPSAE